MKINSVAILGAGAIGAYFIWGLSDKLGDNLWVVAEGERKSRLEQEGLNINGKNYRLNVKTPQEAQGADLLLVSTKYGALRDALDSIEKITADNTIVMSLLNGVDSEEIIAERIDSSHIVYSLMKIASERKGMNVVFDGPSTLGLYYGEKNQKEPSDRMLAIAELLEGTEIHYHMCDDILKNIWLKYALNVSRNQPQAIVGCGVGAYDDSEYVGNMCVHLREEVAAVAAAKGIDISNTESANAKGTKVTKKARYSMLQDMDAKRHTEVDMFAGAMVRMGRELGIATPYNEVVYNIIKAMEEKNDGKFDYQ